MADSRQPLSSSWRTNDEFDSTADHDYRFGRRIRISVRKDQRVTDAAGGD
jgi:hypothetical protein